MNDVMNIQDDPWAVTLNTLSRDGAIKVSIILARAIESDRILNDKTLITILGSAGKSVIMDAIAQDLSDRHSAFKMPPKRFVEGGPSRSLGQRVPKWIVKGIKHQNHSCVMTFRHLSGYHRKGFWERQRMKFDSSRHVVIDFTTEIDKSEAKYFHPHIFISFYKYPDHELEKSWGRQWVIKIEDEALKTDRMRAALDQLRHYEERRQQRHYDMSQLKSAISPRL